MSASRTDSGSDVDPTTNSGVPRFSAAQPARKQDRQQQRHQLADSQAGVSAQRRPAEAWATAAATASPTRRSSGLGTIRSGARSSLTTEKIASAAATFIFCGDAARPGVQRSAEQPGERQHVVDLVGEVAAAGGHHGRVLGRDLRDGSPGRGWTARTRSRPAPSWRSALRGPRPPTTRGTRRRRRAPPPCRRSRRAGYCAAPGRP